MEDDGRRVDDGDVDRGHAALVGEDEGDAEQVTDESGDAVADPEDEVTGVAGDEVGGAVQSLRTLRGVVAQALPRRHAIDAGTPGFRKP